FFVFCFLVTLYLVPNETRLYQDAMHDAVSQSAADQFSLLVKRAHQFKQQGCHSLSETVMTALDHYWHEEKQHIQRVNDETN
ncbi:MAG: hypothetical protein AAF629_35040, partial [Chloroflexota bacterium]